jgi:hypothetical protein
MPLPSFSILTPIETIAPSTATTAAKAAISATKPMAPAFKSDANEAGKAVLRPCCVELFVADGKTLELLTSACIGSQHGSGDRTKPKLQETLISSV